ncbi:MAG TPA: histidine kinase [Bacteroidales bacterium]|nr:histidine kinase [Bacteroidales bacterium]
MNTKAKKIRFWLLYHLGLLAFSFIAAIIMKYQQTGDPFHQSMLVSSLSIFMMSAGIGYLAIFMVNRAKRFSQEQLRQKMLPYLLLFFVVAGLIANLAVTAGVFVWFILRDMDLSEFWPHLFNLELNYANIRFSIWLMFFTITFFYVLWHKTAAREQKLREENLAYRYRNLKAQVNPHFLFNNLNTLSEIVHEDVEKADRFIRELSGIYRYILENEETDLVPLSRELDFIRRYFNLQKERDGEKIQMDIDVPSPERYRLVPVSLQILVENALKHNAMSEVTPLKISIYLEEDSYIVVSNTVQKKNILPQSHHTGLANLDERVKMITGKEIVIDGDISRFIVKLPLTRA